MQDEDTQKRKKINPQHILSGNFLISDWVRKQYKLVSLIAALIFLYIFLDFQAQWQQHHLTNLKKELQDKQFERLSVESDLAKKTRQSAIIRQLQEQGSDLKENMKPVIQVGSIN